MGSTVRLGVTTGLVQLCSDCPRPHPPRHRTRCGSPGSESCQVGETGPLRQSLARTTLKLCVEKTRPELMVSSHRSREVGLDDPVYPITCKSVASTGKTCTEPCSALSSSTSEFGILCLPSRIRAEADAVRPGYRYDPTIGASRLSNIIWSLG